MPRLNFVTIIIGLAIAMGLALPAYNVYILQPSLYEALTRDTEQDAIRTARHIASMAFRNRKAPFRAKLDIEQEQLLNRLLYDFSLAKLKVFNLDGMIIYSSDGKGYGTVNDKPYFREKLLRGEPHSKLIKKGATSLEGQIFEKDVVETYVPIRPEGIAIGVFELYYDITASSNALRERIRHSAIFLTAASLTFICLLALLGLREKRSTTRHEIAEERVRKLAYYDTLTELPNSTLFLDRLTQTLRRCEREGELAALLYLDLDHFKEVNDTLGHQVGDALLQDVGERLQSCLRKSDTLARMGGDEFAILLATISDETDASVVAEQILRKMRSPFQLEHQEIFISPSIGIALYPANSPDADSLRKHADIAMYAAKSQGRASYSFFSDEMNRKIIDRRELETGLRRALQQQEFHLVYQPQFDLKSGRVIACEALLRWADPEKGLIPPNRFIPIAEKTGLIRPIGEWVLETACRQNQEWRKNGHTPLRVAVNLSAYQFQKTDLVDTIDRILQETGLPAENLELELTESLLMESAENNILTLTDLKVRKIMLSIDDFGTGYSSLSYLKNFPMDRVKIDQSFIHQISNEHGDSSIIRAIIAMSHSLKLNVVAEGVETREQLEFLKAHHCDEAQGMFLGRPMNAEHFSDFLETKP